MGKLLRCELWKLKRKKLFSIAFTTTFIMPLFFSLLLTDRDLDDMMSVVREENGFLLLIPLTVVLAANLFFAEHDNDTLKNLLCVPVAKGRLALAKLAVLLLFCVGYELAGYAVSLLLAALAGLSLDGWALQLYLTLCTGVLLWAAALPCILVVVWSNRSYIISVLLAFAYTVLNYILHIADAFVMVPLGLNLATFLPVPMIFRWLYQYHCWADAAEETLLFVERFRPYFVPTSVVFAVLLLEALVCALLLIRVYRRQAV